MQEYEATITMTDLDRAAIRRYVEAKREYEKVWDTVPAEDYWTNFWEEDDGPCAKEGVFTLTARFDNGFEMDIKLCGCQDGAPWSEAVLFNKHGGEICYCEPSESIALVGTWTLAHDGVTYTVTVE